MANHHVKKRYASSREEAYGERANAHIQDLRTKIAIQGSGNIASRHAAPRSLTMDEQASAERQLAELSARGITEGSIISLNGSNLVVSSIQTNPGDRTRANVVLALGSIKPKKYCWHSVRHVISVVKN